MNKKIAKFTSILFLVFAFLFALLSLPMLALSISSFIFAILCALLCFIAFKTIKKKYIAQNKTFSKNSPSPQLSQVPDGKMNYNLFEDFVDNNILIYEYEENICLNSNAALRLQGKGGAKVAFIPEPENPYDTNAISILLDGEKIGYVYRGKIQDMINDWLKRNEFFMGYINTYSIENNKATYKIGFYKPINKYDNKRFPLIKINKKCGEFETSSRYENFCNCDDGDFVLIESGYEENYIVITELSEEIGELPKSALDFIESVESPQKIVGILDSCNTDCEFEEERKSTPHVTIFLIK